MHALVQHGDGARMLDQPAAVPEAALLVEAEAALFAELSKGGRVHSLQSTAPSCPGSIRARPDGTGWAPAPAVEVFPRAVPRRGTPRGPARRDALRLSRRPGASPGTRTTGGRASGRARGPRPLPEAQAPGACGQSSCSSHLVRPLKTSSWRKFDTT